MSICDDRVMAEYFMKRINCLGDEFVLPGNLPYSDVFRLLDYAVVPQSLTMAVVVRPYIDQLIALYEGHSAVTYRDVLTDKTMYKDACRFYQNELKDRVESFQAEIVHLLTSTIINDTDEALQLLLLREKEQCPINIVSIAIQRAMQL